jgi:hypothetical protein
VQPLWRDEGFDNTWGEGGKPEAIQVPTYLLQAETPGRSRAPRVLNILELFLGSDREVLRKVVADLDVIALALKVEAGGMLETIQRVIDVDDVIGLTVRIGPRWNVVEVEEVPELPGYDVVSAGGVAAHAETTQ